MDSPADEIRGNRIVGRNGEDDETNEKKNGIEEKGRDDVAGLLCGTEIRYGLWCDQDRRWLKILGDLWNISTSERRRDFLHASHSPIPLKIHQILLGDRTIPPKCETWMKSWRYFHPQWEYKLWRDEDVANLSLRNQQRFAAATNPAEKSDILRLELLWLFGGIYADVDMECLKPLDILHYRYTCYMGLSNVGFFEINNAIIASVPRHPLLNFLFSVSGHAWAEWGDKDVSKEERILSIVSRTMKLDLPQLLASVNPTSFIETTGPGFLTRGVMRWLSLENHPMEDNDRCTKSSSVVFSPVSYCFSRSLGILPVVSFYPLSNRNRATGDDDVRKEGQRASIRPSISYAVHHWAKTWAAAMCESIES